MFEVSAGIAVFTLANNFFDFIDIFIHRPSSIAVNTAECFTFRAEDENAGVAGCFEFFFEFSILFFNCGLLLRSRKIGFHQNNIAVRKFLEVPLAEDSFLQPDAIPTPVRPGKE